MRLSIRQAWRTDPIGYLQRGLGSSEMAALAAAAVFGAPAFLLGLSLVDRAGPAHLSPAQLLLAAPIGALLAGVLIASSAWMSAYLGVPGVRLVRPAVGSVASWVLALVRLLLLSGWAAAILRLVGLWAEEAGRDLRMEVTAEGWMAAVAFLGTLLAMIGPAWTARWWVRLFAFWAGLALAMWVLWNALSGLDPNEMLTQPATGRFWLGVDGFVALGLLWWPLCIDVARLGNDEGSALSGAGFGFGIPALVMVLVGGLVALASPDLDLGTTGLSSSLPAALGGFGVFAWLIVMEVDGIFGLVYTASTSLTPFLRRIPGPVMAAVVGMATLSAAVLVDPGQVTRALELAIAILAPVAAVTVVDFFFVRSRDYSIDDLYVVGGLYSVVNPLGLTAVLLGLIVSLASRPVGPEAVTRVLEAVFPTPFVEAVGNPPLISSMVVSGGAYLGLGRWKIARREYVSGIRGI